MKNIITKHINKKYTIFKDTRNSKLFVDKSNLIKITNDSIDDIHNKYICASRPRRFGKTLTAEMLNAYYSKGQDSHFLFDGLNISKDKNCYEKYINKFNVISFNLVKELSNKPEDKSISCHISKSIVDDLKIIYGNKLIDEDKTLQENLDNIHIYNDEKFIFIIDEWDFLFREKYSSNVKYDYLNFLRSLLKDSNYIALVYMTGILPIKKHNTQSSLNMFKETSLITPMNYEEFIGFTEDEVKEISKKYKLRFKDIKEWYDGYRVGKIKHIYNPDSVIKSLEQGELGDYWTTTEDYSCLKLYLNLDFDGIKDKIIHMILGESIPINPKNFKNDVVSLYSCDDIFTLLVHLGYLSYNAKDNSVCIPNKEIKEEFESAIKVSKGYEPFVLAIKESEKLLEDTLKKDAQSVSLGIKKVHEKISSIMTYKRESDIALSVITAYYAANRDYCIQREFATERGYADIVLIPKRHVHKPAIIIELKYLQTVKSAIEQIKNKEYGKSLKNYFGKILLVGINYTKDGVYECIIEDSSK